MNDHVEQGSEFGAAIGYLDFVAADPDLVTFFELKNLGFATTSRVSPTREDLLENCDIQQLRFEIGRDYKIDPDSVIQAEQLCLAAIHHKTDSFLYGEV